jgi:hypothetical protein
MGIIWGPHKLLRIFYRALGNRLIGKSVTGVVRYVKKRFDLTPV